MKYYIRFGRMLAISTVLVAEITALPQTNEDLEIKEVELSAEEKLRLTEDLFQELVAIRKLSTNEYDSQNAVLRESALEKEVRSRDRAAHQWLAQVLLTTQDHDEAEEALSLIADGYWPTGARYPDIAREAVIQALGRKKRKEPGSAGRESLAGVFLNIGKPGDFPLLEPFLEEASGPFGDSLIGTIYQVAAQVIGTENDLPALRRHAERLRMIAEHMPPGHRESQLSTANRALAQIRELEARLAAEKLAANQTVGVQNPNQDSRSRDDHEVVLRSRAGDSSASSKGSQWIWIGIFLFVLLGVGFWFQLRKYSH
ncbi:MAG: hypothetical protein JNK37_10460 [Verrucomicrobiales bacterium]|nr:hypothetical protein [Verrucomicrobiales bacterium]